MPEFKIKKRPSLRAVSSSSGSESTQKKHFPVYRKFQTTVVSFTECPSPNSRLLFWNFVVRSAYHNKTMDISFKNILFEKHPVLF